MKEEILESNASKALIINAPDQTSQQICSSVEGMACHVCKDFDALAENAIGYKCIVLYLDQPVLRWKRWLYQDLARRLLPTGELILIGNPFLSGDGRIGLYILKLWIKAILWKLPDCLKSISFAMTLKQACGVEFAGDYDLREISSIKSNFLVKLGLTKVNPVVFRKENSIDDLKTEALKAKVQHYFGDWFVDGKVPIDYNPIKVIKPQILLDQAIESNVLVLSPHPDDELIGCGGTLLGLAHNGAKIHVVQMTEGATCKALKQFSEEDRRTLRLHEAQSVAESLDFSLTCWVTGSGFALENTSETRAHLSSILTKLQPKVVFVPSASDLHPEHRLAFEIFIEVYHELDLIADVYEYPVWGFLQPDIAVTVTNDYDAVLDALYLYRVAMKAEDYVSRCRILTRYHAEKLKQSGDCVELFSKL